MRYAYPCILEPETDGGFSVSFPDVPGALTCGDSCAEALVRAEDALVGALGAHFSLRGAIPLPSPVQEGQELVALRPVAAAKVALYTAMREQGLTNVALGERLGVSEAAVRKLLDPDHRSQSQHHRKGAPCRGPEPRRRNRALAASSCTGGRGRPPLHLETSA